MHVLKPMCQKTPPSGHIYDKAENSLRSSLFMHVLKPMCQKRFQTVNLRFVSELYSIFSLISTFPRIFLGSNLGAAAFSSKTNDPRAFQPFRAAQKPHMTNIVLQLLYINIINALRGVLGLILAFFTQTQGNFHCLRKGSKSSLFKRKKQIKARRLI